MKKISSGTILVLLLSAILGVCTPVYAAEIAGDVNEDMYVNASDALDVLKCAAKLSEVTNTLAADVTGDGNIDANDALEILKYSAKLIFEFATDYGKSWLDICSPYQYTNTEEYRSKDDKTFVMGGENYTDGYVFYLWNPARKAEAIYNLDGQFDSVSFTVGHIDNTTNASAVLNIYIDGNLSESVDLKYDELPKKIIVELNKARQLKLELISNEPLNTYDIYYGISDGKFDGVIEREPLPVPESDNWLEVCQPYQYRSGEEYRSEDNKSFTMSGKDYSDGYVFYLWNPARLAEALYNLDGRFESVSFEVGHIDGKTNANGVLEIYLDGQLSKSINLKYDSLPEKISIGLTGVNHMKIKFISNEPLNTYDIYYGIGAGEFTVSE